MDYLTLLTERLLKTRLRMFLRTNIDILMKLMHIVTAYTNAVTMQATALYQSLVILDIKSSLVGMSIFDLSAISQFCGITSGSRLADLAMAYWQM